MTERTEVLPVNLSKDELKAVEDLADELELSEGAVMRQALRFYQLTHMRLKRGETVHFSGDDLRARQFSGSGDWFG